jgi:hypothetical protein
MFEGINYVAVIVAALVYYIIGSLWYTVLFGKMWREEQGVPPDAKGTPPVGSLIGQFISTLIYTFGVAILMKLYGAGDVKGGLVVAMLITVFIVAPINSGNLFFTGKKRLFLLDVSERAVGTLVVGIIIGLWQ